MKKLVTFASHIRLNAMLCCGAAVLLTACGAGTSDTNAGQWQTAATLNSSADQSAANSAAALNSSADQSAANSAATLNSSADQSAANSAATAVPNAADAASAPAAEAAAAGNYEPSAYDSNPQSGAQADASAPEAAAAAAQAEPAAPVPTVSM